MLAIIAPAFNIVSETFIADHARTLAPGATVLVSRDSRGTQAYGYPVLSHLQLEPTAFGKADGAARSLVSRLRRRFGPPLAYGDRMRLAEFFRVQEVTVVLAEYGPVGLMAADTCARMGIPLYVFFHGMDASTLLRNPKFVRQYRWMFPKVAGVMASSQTLVSNLIGIGAPAERCHAVPCGPDVARFGRGRPEPGRILALGRLTDKKAPHLTVRAFGQIAARFPGAHLDVIGDGPLRAACEAEIASAGIADRVTLHGALSREACRPFLDRAAIFAQHSIVSAGGDTEGTPISITEAMACHIPVVATRHSGIVTQVIEGETGYIVEEGDVEGMAAGMARLLADPAAAARMGDAGRALAESRLDQKVLHARMREIMGLPAPDAVPDAVPNAVPDAASPQA